MQSLYKDKEIIFIGEPEFHNSRIEGPNSAPTFWHHSINDIAERVSSAGFVARLSRVRLCSAQEGEAIVVVCEK